MTTCLSRVAALVAGLACLGLADTCGGQTASTDGILQDEANGDNWAAYGRTFSSDHYSPLAQINTDNVRRLSLKWYRDLPEPGSLLTTPLAVNGILYFAMGYDVIHAVDARTGKELWRYDPQVTEVAGEKMRRAWGTRGLAYWNDKIYVGTVDGRLIAIAAQSGRPVWSVLTTDGPNDGRYITGAPWAFNGKIAIGHGGADFSPVRGYVTTYDAETGKQLWRFYIVPGDPAKGFESAAMAMAAKTWKGEWWRFGGGGTAWNAMAYDPRFNRLYVGTGNGDPWNQKIRSPGGGDNLFLSSIVALDADTGAYVWHYQTTPGETWDFVSTMDIELATMTIGGMPRPVILHAPKNGFFYVIDRETGKLVSAEKFAKVNWADRIDQATGRPVENPQARYADGKGFLMYPGPAGAHNIEPMAYSPQTRLVYIPTRESAFFYSDAGVDLNSWQPKPGMVYVNGLGSASSPTPLPPARTGLLAWDPARQARAWFVPLGTNPNGGVTSTGGNLVFQGTAAGKFVAYAADSGAPVWTFDAQSGISSEPIAYSVDGNEYITVLAGYRGLIDKSPWDFYSQPRRILTFALDGKENLPSAVGRRKQFVDDPQVQVDPQKTSLGRTIELARCSDCHGIGLTPGGVAPDLRESRLALTQKDLDDVLRNGSLVAEGMPRFSDLSTDDVGALFNYIRSEARKAAAGGTAADPEPYEGPRQ